MWDYIAFLILKITYTLFLYGLSGYIAGRYFADGFAQLRRDKELLIVCIFLAVLLPFWTWFGFYKDLHGSLELAGLFFIGAFFVGWYGNRQKPKKLERLQ